MTRKPIITGLIVALTGVALLRCDNQNFSRLLSRGGLNLPSGETIVGAPLAPGDIPTVPGGGPGGDDPTPTPGPNEGTPIESITQSWLQPSGSGRIPVDMIFVEDTSGSLDTERAAVNASLAGFLGNLETLGITDYCVGVMFGHVGNLSGKLYQTGSNPACLCSKPNALAGTNGLTAAQIVDKFSANIAKPPSDNLNSDGGEAMNYSFHQSFSDATALAANEATGCFRRNAALAYIPISDENDIGTSPRAPSSCSSAIQAITFTPAGPASVPDPDCQEAPARLAYYSDASGNLVLTPTKVVIDAKSFQAPLPFYAAAVAYNGSIPIPASGENEYGYGLIDVATRAGGDQIDLMLASLGRQAEFDAAFSTLATNLTTGVSLLTVFDLSSRACTGSIIVRTGRSTGNLAADLAAATVRPFIMDPSRTRIFLNPNTAGSAGDTVWITYNHCN